MLRSGTSNAAGCMMILLHADNIQNLFSDSYRQPTVAMMCSPVSTIALTSEPDSQPDEQGNFQVAYTGALLSNRLNSQILATASILHPEPAAAHLEVGYQGFYQQLAIRLLL